nr:hypothetical protein [Mycoplasmopsis bovis]
MKPKRRKEEKPESPDKNQVEIKTLEEKKPVKVQIKAKIQAEIKTRWKRPKKPWGWKKHLKETKTPEENKTPRGKPENTWGKIKHLWEEILRKARQTMALVEVKIIFEVRMKMFGKV